MTSFAMTDFGIDNAAIDRCWDAWEQRNREWRRFDRVNFTEKQDEDAADKLMDSTWFSSETLERPSIPEFTAIISDDKPENTYVCFRRTLMRQDDFLDTLDERWTRTITPVIDAHVYLNNQGALCNMVVTISKTVLESEDGKRMTSTSQFVTYAHDDPLTKHYMGSDPQFFMEFMRSIKCLYLAVQMMSTERPEVMAAEIVREEYSGTVKEKGRYKSVLRAHMDKVIRISDDAFTDTPKSHHTMTCPCWGVAGHMRTYKSGKQVWIKPYRKGKQRNNPEAYQPKEYEISKEDTN